MARAVAVAMATTVDVAVVGGGLAGLLAAGLLAAAGRRVTVLEAGPAPGGRARSTEHEAGPAPGGPGRFRLNLGPRALYRGPARSALRRIGIRPPGGPPPLRRAWALYEGRLHPGFMTVGGVLTSPLLGPRDRAALAGVLGLARARPALAAITGAEWLAEALPSPRSRLAAAALIRVATYVGAPELASADAIAGHLATARLGVRYVDGGWQSMVDALHARLAGRGVPVAAGQRVSTVDAGGTGRHVLTTVDGRVIAARAVVVAGLAPARAAALLGRPDLARGTGPPLHAACLDVALRQLPDPRRPFVYGVDEPLYLVVHSAHARFGPPGGAVLHLVRYDDGTEPGPATRERLEGLLDAYQPGWREQLVHARYLPRMVATYGLPVAGGGLAGRPGVAVPDRTGIFLAGDWVGRVGLLADASAASAVGAAAAAERYLGEAR